MVKKIVNVRLEADLWKEARIQAIREDKELQDWLAEAIQEKLEKAKNG
jgi:predicted HicB family RNase H-like nuclease